MARPSEVKNTPHLNETPFVRVLVLSFSSLWQDLGKFVVFKVGVMFTTLFLFFTTTTLVSFTLRETQVRIFFLQMLFDKDCRVALPCCPLRDSECGRRSAERSSVACLSAPAA